MDANEEFFQSIIENKLNKIKSQIISSQIVIPRPVSYNFSLLSPDVEIINDVFQKYKINIVNDQKSLLNHQLKQYDQKLKEIKLRKEEEEHNNYKCYVQPIKGKRIRTHCKLLNEEKEDELENNASNFIKKLQKDKVHRKKKENGRIQKNLYNYISQLKKSSELNMIKEQSEKNKNELQKKASHVSNTYRNYSYYYKDSMPSLIQNHSNSNLSNQSFKIKSPALGTCISPPEVRQANIRSKVRKAGANLIAYNEHKFINNNYRGNHSILYINMEPVNKNTFEFTNQKRSPYYFNDPKYNNIIIEISEKKKSKNNDETNIMIN